MIKKLLLSIGVALLLSVSLRLSAQDPEFTQYYANPLYLNPAFAGSELCPRLVLNYRNQWPAISGTYVTYCASYDQHIDKISGGLGLLVYNDQAGEGVLNTTSASLIYSYRLELSRNFSIKAGLQASYFQKHIDWDRLTFGDMIDPKYGFIYGTQEIKPNETVRAADFSAGILGFGKDIYLGVAVHHLTEPLEGFMSVSKLPMKITAHVGGVIPLERRIGKRKRKMEDPYISPNVLFMKQQDFNQLCYGFYFNKYPFVTGVWFRQSFENTDSFIVLVGIQQSSFKFGYSYDITVSKLSNSTAGAHELSFGMQFPCKPKRKRVRAIACPSF